jgi:dTDP-4-amino-4,6-dideoxygalactose transaminase
VFCDVDDATGLIDLDSAAAVAGPRTAAVLPVHLYGQACDMTAVGAFAAERGLAVVEDAAQAHGATHGGRRVGSFGLAAGFSFYPSKNLGALGDGGAICTNDSGLAARARELRHLGQRGKGDHAVLGFNERLDGLQAAVLRVKLAHLDDWNGRRQSHAAALRAGLEGAAALLGEEPDSSCVYHLFPIRVPERDSVAARLGDAGIQTGVHYSPSLPEQPPFARTGADGSLEVAADWAARELSLPMFAELEQHEVDRVIAECSRVLTTMGVPT